MTHPLYDLVEDEAQIEASAALAALRRRMREGTQVTPRLSPALASTLRPYQAAGRRLAGPAGPLGRGRLLADEMGLGKTLQTLAVLLHRASLRAGAGGGADLGGGELGGGGGALRARAAGAPSTAGPTAGRRCAGLRPGDVVVTSYGIADLDAEALAAIPFATLVLDEAQAIKNATTERAKALRGAGRRLAARAHRARPIENHLAELWSLFRLVVAGLLGSWEQFRARFAMPIEKFGGRPAPEGAGGAAAPVRAAPDQGARWRASCRRAPRSSAWSRLSPEEQALYEQLRAALSQEIAEAKKDPNRDAGSVLRFKLLAALTRLRQLCCHPRLVYPRADAGVVEGWRTCWSCSTSCARAATARWCSASSRSFLALVARARSTARACGC